MTENSLCSPPCSSNGTHFNTGSRTWKDNTRGVGANKDRIVKLICIQNVSHAQLAVALEDSDPIESMKYNTLTSTVLVLTASR